MLVHFSLCQREQGSRYDRMMKTHPLLRGTYPVVLEGPVGCLLALREEENGHDILPLHTNQLYQLAIQCDLTLISYTSWQFKWI